ncbi:MAG: sigma-70 family RNA polymerase sigma factor [Planctomycetota bacterium]
MRSRDDHADDLVLAHAGFVRRLARQLVVDVHDADDAVQELWLAAQGQRDADEPSPRTPRAFLAAMLRNRLANVRRGAARRTVRERASARDAHELSSDPAQIARELEVQETVVAAVAGLREPYRTAVYLRYYRDLSPKAIARELGVPLATVDTRLLRGRALLRDRLGRELGERDGWVSALLPLCHFANPATPALPLPGPGGVATLGALTMNLKLIIATTATALTLIAAGFLLFTGDRGPHEPEHVTDTANVPATTALPLRPGPATGTERLEVAAPSTPAAPAARTAEAAAKGVVLEGRLVDLGALPVPATGLKFTAAAGPARVLASDAAGRFRLVDPAGPGRFTVDDPGWTTVFVGVVPSSAVAGDVVSTTVVAAPAHELTLRVVDEARRPLPDASVQIRVPAALRSRFDLTADASVSMRREGRTDTTGRFAERIPLAPSLEVRVASVGRVAIDLDLATAGLEAGGASERVVVLRAPGRLPSIVQGEVVDAAGVGVPDACVELGRLGARTDGAGRFHFDLEPEAPFVARGSGEPIPARLSAAARGRLPVSLDLERDAAGAVRWPEPLRLVLDAEPLALTGRVVDESGSPLEDAVVFLPKLHLMGNRTTIEAELRGQDEDGEFVISERTDASGAFRFAGLMNEPYAIAAYLEGSLLRGQVDVAHPGGRPVEIVIDTTAVWPEVHGHVRLRDGRPVGKAKITPSMVTQRADGPSGDWSTSEEADPIVSDAAGRFVLRNIPRAHMSVMIEHPEVHFVHGRVLPVEGARVDRRGHLVDCDLIVEPRLRFRVQLHDSREADAFTVEDAAGDRLAVHAQSGNRYHSTRRPQVLEAGRSRPLFVDRRAAVLVLHRAGTEVRRIALHLTWRQETLLH